MVSLPIENVNKSMADKNTNINGLNLLDHNVNNDPQNRAY